MGLRETGDREKEDGKIRNKRSHSEALSLGVNNFLQPNPKPGNNKKHA